MFDLTIKSIGNYCSPGNLMTKVAMSDTKDAVQKGEGAAILSISSAAHRSKKNQEILTFTCTAFFLFAMAEVVGALTSNSLSLLGDAGAMSIDVFTVSLSLHN